MAIAMDLDFDDTAERGLRWYVRSVTDAFGVSPQSAVVQAESPANAYVAIDGRLPGVPDLDVALLWDERRGWSIVIESGRELRRVVDLGGDRWPAPREVADWVHAHLLVRPQWTQGVAPRPAIGGERWPEGEIERSMRRSPLGEGHDAAPAER